jgi:hypothetical protein
MRYILLSYVFLLTSCVYFPTEKSQVLFDGRNLDTWTLSNFGGEGEVNILNGAVHLDYGNPLTGITWAGRELPKDYYAIELEAQKLAGNDFFVGLTFPVREDFCSLILGGWGGVTCGLSSFDYEDASNNETSVNIKFDKNRWYKIRLEVAGDSIRTFLDGKKIIETQVNKRKVHIRPEVFVSKPLGICAFETQVAYRNIKLIELVK